MDNNKEALLDDDDGTYVDLAIHLSKEGDFKGAIAAVTQAINLNPTMAPWYLNRAHYWMELGCWSEAAADCTTALNHCPQLTSTGSPFPFQCFIYSQRANAWVGMGNWSAACADWQALLASRPGDMEALVGLTLAYRHLNQFQQAEECYQEVSSRLSRNGGKLWFDEQCLYAWQGPLAVAVELLLEMYIGRIPVISSNVCYIAYDTIASELQVAFYPDSANDEDEDEDDELPGCYRMRDYPSEPWEECRVYRYTDVPAWIFDGLKNADSKGSYLYHNIAFKYPYERIQ